MSLPRPARSARSRPRTRASGSRGRARARPGRRAGPRRAASRRGGSPRLWLEDFLRVDGEEGSFYRQPSSMPIFQQNLNFALFSTDLRYFSKSLQNTKNFDNHLRFAAIPAKSCEICSEKNGFERKLSQLL